MNAAHAMINGSFIREFTEKGCRKRQHDPVTAFTSFSFPRFRLIAAECVAEFPISYVFIWKQATPLRRLASGPATARFTPSPRMTINDRLRAGYLGPDYSMWLAALDYPKSDF